jgi:DNA-binding transcriptional regulator YhcF (GntR family)
MISRSNWAKDNNRQIVEQICRGIDAGVYRPGEALPSQLTLALELCINPNAFQRAFDELLHDGVIESQRGRGVFCEIGSANRGWPHGKEVGMHRPFGRMTGSPG